MATSLTQIAGFLKNRDMKFSREDDRDMIIVPFRHDELDALLVVVKLEENGEFLKVFSPKLFMCKDSPHKAQLLQALLLTSWETKMLQWEYDPNDGEVRAMIEFPLEDALLTEKQFFRAFDGLIHLVHRFYPRLKKILDSGKDPTSDDGHSQTDPLSQAFREFLSGGGDDTGKGNEPDIPDGF